MTRDRISARNRANAKKSTGPKTAQGKAVASQNARRHGATSRPDPKSVLTWLAIILDEPGVSWDAFMPADERGFRALALAEAEVRHASAERALMEFDADMEEKAMTGEDYKALAQVVALQFGLENLPRDIPTVDLYHKARLAAASLEAKATHNTQRRLLRRYLGEARAQRRRALRAWVEISRAERDLLAA